MIGHKMKCELIAVIVLYKKTVTESETYCSLLAAVESAGVEWDLTVLVHDNSPTPSPSPPDHPGIQQFYVHDESNPGICRAYNHGLKLAQEGAAPWLLLLDQDTEIGEEYVHALADGISQVGANPDVACMVPNVRSNGKTVSPVKVIQGVANARHPVKNKTRGISPFPVMGINSGSLWRTRFLQEIGGFLEDFPLDYLDHWAFAKLNQMGRHVFLMDTTIEHNLSILDFENQVSVQRYQSIISSELRFLGNFTPRYVRVVSLARMLLRSIRFLFKFRNKRFSWMTFAALFSLLLLLHKKNQLEVPT